MNLKLTAAVLAASTMLCAPLATAQVADPDPALQQQVSAEERIAPAGERTVISHGHADLGATYVDGQLVFLVRDDSEVPPVWRHLDDVVFQVGDEAVQTLPETGDFDFTGAKPGENVWVIPQTEVAGVPWLGWNTQAPALLERSSAGVSLEFRGHDGPGDFSLFLQPGGFHQPQQLWNSRLEGTQPMWVQPNTHTHANWVFTGPGVHLVGVRAVVKDNAGQVHTDDQVVRIAIGTDPAEAFDTEFAGPAAAQRSTNLVALGIALAVGAVVVALAVIAALRASQRRRK
ncbi:choice-of-anchor M domain-containing protein [Corynebacterium qintianiae]|uniref:choice-of-anchor M domain-containing protein n=1 Tax=Corynebacterium qintianiae TaxID=2709392 RepID=UPI002017C639|nr:choice-of-anchor M domain-containing protein [Corynebacterium qintianiae]